MVSIFDVPPLFIQSPVNRRIELTPVEAFVFWEIYQNANQICSRPALEAIAAKARRHRYFHNALAPETIYADEAISNIRTKLQENIPELVPSIQTHWKSTELKQGGFSFRPPLMYNFEISGSGIYYLFYRNTFG